MTRFDYDEWGSLAKVTDALGNATTSQYDKYGNLAQTTSPSGATQRYEYDEMNRLVAEYTPDPERGVYQKNPPALEGRGSGGGWRKTSYSYSEAFCDCSSG